MSANTAPKAKDAMTSNPWCATPDLSVRELAAMFSEKNISGAPVIARRPDGPLVGVVSRTDLFRRITEQGSAHAAYLFDLLKPGGASAAAGGGAGGTAPLIVVADFMAENPVTVGPEDALASVAKVMAARRIHRVVVIDAAKRPLGIITTLDVLRFFPAA